MTTNPEQTTTLASQLASQARKARAASAKAVEHTERRDELIRAMRADGAALRTIAEAAGLSHTAIANILVRGNGNGRTNGS